jgi:hypothetical protein
MLKKIAGPLKVRRGQTVHFRVKLDTARMTQAFCPVYFAEARGGFPPSPHVPLAKLDIRSGEPKMLNPSFLLACIQLPERQISIVADEDGTFSLMQDVDLRDDPTAKGWIWKDGPFRKLLAHARRWLR